MNEQTQTGKTMKGRLMGIELSNFQKKDGSTGSRWGYKIRVTENQNFWVSSFNRFDGIDLGDHIECIYTEAPNPKNAENPYRNAQAIKKISAETVVAQDLLTPGGNNMTVTTGAETDILDKLKKLDQSVVTHDSFIITVQGQLHCTDNRAEQLWDYYQLSLDK